MLSLIILSHHNVPIEAGAINLIDVILSYEQDSCGKSNYIACKAET